MTTGSILSRKLRNVYILLSSSNAPKSQSKTLLLFYVTCVGPVLEYSCQVFHFVLPAYLSDTIEWVQKRFLTIIYPNIDYTDSLDLSGILKLSNRNLKACDILFNDIVTTPSYNLGQLPERYTQDIILDRLESLSPKSKGLRTPLSCFQLEFITNPDV